MSTRARDRLEKVGTWYAIGAIALLVLGTILLFTLPTIGTLAMGLGFCCVLASVGYRLVSDKIDAEAESDADPD